MPCRFPRAAWGRSPSSTSRATSTSPPRRSCARPSCARSGARVVVNLTAVRYMDSSGLASLIEGLKAARDVGSRFVLFGLNTTVREVFHISKLTTFFEIHEDEEQSLAP